MAMLALVVSARRNRTGDAERYREGGYDPVRDDNLSPALLPAFYIHLVLQVLISAVSSIRKIRSRPDPQIKRRPIPVACWLTQIAVWIAYGINAVR